MTNQKPPYPNQQAGRQGSRQATAGFFQKIRTQLSLPFKTAKHDSNPHNTQQANDHHRHHTDNNDNNQTNHDNTNHDNTKHSNTKHSNTKRNNTEHDNTKQDNQHDNTKHDNARHDDIKDENINDDEIESTSDDQASISFWQWVDMHDLRAGRSYWFAMMALVLFILIGAIKTAHQTQERHETYRLLVQARQQYQKLQTEETRLIIEQQTFSATPIVAQRSVVELGMFFPTKDNRLIIHAEEPSNP